MNVFIKSVTNVEWTIFDSHIFDYSTLTSYDRVKSILIDIIPSNIPICDPNRNQRMKYI